MGISGTRICSGLLSDFEAVGVGGDPVYRAATQIRALLQKELGSPTAELFGIPVRDDKSNAVDWYAATVGDVVRYDSLTSELQAMAWHEIESQFQNVEDLSSRLLSEGKNDTAKAYGELLRAIQSFPSASQVYLLNGSPVIAFWGFRPPGLTASHRPLAEIIPPQRLVQNASIQNHTEVPAKPSLEHAPTTNREAESGQAAANPTSPSAPALSLAKTVGNPVSVEPITDKRSWWQRFGWWLFLVLLLVFGIPAAFRACSSDFPLYDANKSRQPCPAPSNPSCPAPSVSPPTQPKTTPPPPTLDPVPLNKEALQRKDLNVFNGKWTLITNLMNARTHAKIIVEFSFDNNGNGEAQVHELNGATCNGTAIARINSESSFDVAMSKLTCSDGSGYTANEAKCVVQSNYRKADCVLRCIDGACPSVFERR